MEGGKIWQDPDGNRSDHGNRKRPEECVSLRCVLQFSDSAIRSSKFKNITF